MPLPDATRLRRCQRSDKAQCEAAAALALQAFGPDNIRVNALCAGFIDTDITAGMMTPARRAHNAPMNMFTALWQRVVRAVQSLLFPRYWLAVVEHEPLRLVFSSDHRQVTVDGTARQVRSGEKVLATFEAIQSIDVVHHPRAGDGSKPEHWSISLYLGRSSRAYVGRSRKQAAADKAAKLLATITGKTVRSVEALSHPSVIPSR